MSEDGPQRECAAKRYAPRQDCAGKPEFDVVYRTAKGTVLDRHPACFTHGLAETDRHYQSAGMARCDLEPVR